MAMTDFVRKLLEFTEIPQIVLGGNASRAEVSHALHGLMSMINFYGPLLLSVFWWDSGLWVTWISRSLVYAVPAILYGFTSTGTRRADELFVTWLKFVHIFFWIGKPLYMLMLVM